ncbi:alcohol dehydrogenase catalytic domain-containing protein [Pseudomonas sp. PCH446]
MVRDLRVRPARVRGRAGVHSGGRTAPAHRDQGQCILGHEFCGEIVEIGAGVQGFSVGEPVAADACQHCGPVITAPMGCTTFAKTWRSPV